MLKWQSRWLRVSVPSDYQQQSTISLRSSVSAKVDVALHLSIRSLFQVQIIEKELRPIETECERLACIITTRQKVHKLPNLYRNSSRRSPDT